MWTARRSKLVAVPSKEAFLYVFDRVTGKPVWPIEERPVPQSDVPGEKTSPTQPFPTKPPAYARNYHEGSGRPDRLHAGNARAGDRSNLKRYRVEGMFTPPVVGDPKGIGWAAINLGNASGGTNWPGAGFDPETAHRVTRRRRRSSVTPISLRIPPPGFTDIKYVSGRNDQEFREAQGPGFGSAADAPQRNAAGGGRGAGPAGAPAGAGAAPAGGRGAGGGGGGLNVQGLPIVKPPYGVISAINLDRGDLQWQVPYGETPDNVRNSPALKGLNIGNTGRTAASDCWSPRRW